MVFKYCDDSQLPLLDLPDLRAVLQYLGSDEGKPALAQYGGMSGATVGVLLRKMVELESQGAEPVLRRARVRRQGHAARDLRRPRRRDLPRAARRAGQAAALVHLHDVDAGRALPQPARGGRPAQAEAGLLLRRGAPAVRRCLEGVPRPGRAGRPADPLEGRRRVLRDPDAEGRARATCWRSSATGSSTRSGPTRRTTTPRSGPPSGPFPRPRSTTSRRRSPRSASARRW